MVLGLYIERVMALLPILVYPNERLRVPGEPVEDFGPDFQRFVDDLVETMYLADGVGLAAPQVGSSLRVFVIDPSAGQEPDALRVYVNPKLLNLEGEVVYEEGCLSFPGVRENVVRAERVEIEALDRHGDPFRMEADGLLAIAMQHENDHLNGKLLIDHLGPIRRRRLHRQMLKWAAQGGLSYLPEATAS